VIDVSSEHDRVGVDGIRLIASKLPMQIAEDVEARQDERG